VPRTTQEALNRMSENADYIRKHGEVTEAEAESINGIIAIIEARGRVRTRGDIVICHGYNKHDDRSVVYRNGLLDRPGSNQWEVCVRPYVPFIYGTESLSLSVGGGYFFRPKIEELMYSGRAIRQFKVWGHCGACAAGAIIFNAEVNSWDYTDLEGIY
jgi:hypothetical protein